MGSGWPTKVGATVQKFTIRIRESKVLIIGLKGVNSEVCKNLVLAGVHSVTILDHEKVSEEDLGSHLFLSPNDVGKNVLLVTLLTN